MKIKLLASASLLALLVSGWVSASEWDLIYNFSVTSAPKGAVASEVWVGIQQGSDCSAQQKIYQSAPTPAVASQFTSLGFGLNSAAFQSAAEKFKSTAYNCGVTKVINKNGRVLATKSFDLSSDDGKIFVAKPASQTIG